MLLAASVKLSNAVLHTKALPISYSLTGNPLGQPPGCKVQELVDAVVYPLSQMLLLWGLCWSHCSPADASDNVTLLGCWVTVVDHATVALPSNSCRPWQHTTYTAHTTAADHGTDQGCCHGKDGKVLFLTAAQSLADAKLAHRDRLPGCPGYDIDQEVAVQIAPMCYNLPVALYVLLGYDKEIEIHVPRLSLGKLMPG